MIWILICSCQMVFNGHCQGSPLKIIFWGSIAKLILSNLGKKNNSRNQSILRGAVLSKESSDSTQKRILGEISLKWILFPYEALTCWKVWKNTESRSWDISLCSFEPHLAQKEIFWGKSCLSDIHLFIAT